MSPLGWIEAACRRLTRIGYHPAMLVVAPLAVAGGRGLQEDLFFAPRGFEVPLLNYFLCYLLLQLLMLGVISASVGESYRRFGGVVGVGLLLGWLPAAIDRLLAAAGVEQPGRWYRFFEGFEWDFAAPYQLVGETVTVWLSIALVTLYVGVVTRRAWRALVAAAGAWVAFQLVAFVLPAAAGAAMGEGARWRIEIGINWAYLAGSVIAYGAIAARTVGPSFLRVQHALPFALLAGIGARMAGAGVGTAVERGGVILLAGLLLLVANDYFDRGIDGGAGRAARPVTRDDVVFAVLVKLVLLAQLLQADRAAAYLPASYLAIWTAYHWPGVRLKRLPGLAHLSEGLAAAVCFAYGARPPGGFSPKGDVALFALLAFVGFGVGSTIKDYKDVEQDRAAGIPTVFVLAARRGRLGLARWGATAALVAGMAVPAAAYAVVVGPSAVAAALGALALAPLALVAFVRAPRRAVALVFWTVSLQLGTLAATVPALLARG